MEYIQLYNVLLNPFTMHASEENDHFVHISLQHMGVAMTHRMMYHNN